MIQGDLLVKQWFMIKIRQSLTLKKHKSAINLIREASVNKILHKNLKQMLYCQILSYQVKFLS